MIDNVYLNNDALNQIFFLLYNINIYNADKGRESGNNGKAEKGSRDGAGAGRQSKEQGWWR
tara:strand:- start:405 stop:587 length:183 start_codon:yes stop_codon:yes gene_type:complete